MKFSEIIDSWFSSKKGFVKESTLSVYYNAIRKHILPYWEDIDTSAVRKNELQMFIGSRISAGLSISSAKDINMIMRQIIMYANDDMGLNIDVSLKVKYPRKSMEEQSMEQVYTKDECAKFIEYFERTKSLSALGVIIALYTGLRIGEVSGLQFADIDLSEKSLCVRRTVERIVDIDNGKTKMLVGLPKTPSSQRCIPLHADLIHFIQPIKEFFHPNFYVLSGADNPIEPRTFRNAYYRICKEIGIKKPLKFHALRHTCATLLIEAGNDVKNVSAVLGHSNVTTTLNIYTHASFKKQSEAIQSLSFKV